MARRGARVDYRQLQRMQKKMERLEKEADEFCRAMAKEIAARMLSEVIKNTPVADPSTWKTPVKGYVGGTLRRGWTAGKANTNKKNNTVGVNGKNGFASTLDVVKKGDVFEIMVSNNTEYATYVEYGHRTRDHKGWVPGRFMMTISADRVQGKAPAIIERKLTQMLKEAFNGN